LQNALKFRSTGTPPQIDISCYRNSGETVICIRDNGIGIAPEHHDKIFGLFKRLHNPEAYNGTGIGLAICQKIVERYQGQIWVESEYGKGAIFCFRLGEQTNVLKSRAAAGRL
jgi:light-regulated signal transduction histidine kinase (bacteriophytochrome)